ncbi:MAG TPA: hypothetical protein VNP93_08165 [Gaiellaceae bacterium]|nr:hypothetical protein [Gaiellaceae bacterium]
MRAQPLISVAVAAGALAAAGLVAHPAAASELIGRGGGDATLKVNGAGEAHVTWSAAGQARHLVARNAINARPPKLGVPQVSFQLQYGDRTIPGAACRPYDGPPLAWLVRACKAADGSYWALQRWQRLKPNYGGEQGEWELRLSHWAGPLAQLDVWTDWAYRRFDHLYGRYTYRGVPVHGFRVTPQGNPLDDYGRNLYVDTFNSRYGQGWRRENSFLAQRPNGAFCYGFYPHGNRPSGEGRRYRATVIGPGVTPDVMWEATAPGPFDAARDRQASEHQREIFAGRSGHGCKPL